jgi:hypothetical protein
MALRIPRIVCLIDLRRGGPVGLAKQAGRAADVPTARVLNYRLSNCLELRFLSRLAGKEKASGFQSLAFKVSLEAMFFILGADAISYHFFLRCDLRIAQVRMSPPQPF